MTEIERLQDAKRRALAIADERAKENVRLRAERDVLVKALEQARAAMLKIRTASIAGCEEGYGKPEKWADELFRSHGDVTASIKTIDGLLADVSGGKQP
jgi:hypothetical protein